MNYYSFWVLLDILVCLFTSLLLHVHVHACARALTRLRAQVDNKDFVVGLECPERLELWQLRRAEFTDIAVSCRCCLRSPLSGSSKSVSVDSLCTV